MEEHGGAVHEIEKPLETWTTPILKKTFYTWAHHQTILVAKVKTVSDTFSFQSSIEEHGGAVHEIEKPLENWTTRMVP